MLFTSATYRGLTFVEAVPGERLIEDAGDVGRVLEACFAAPAECALLHADNLSPAFFDVSSGLAGAFLQKLRNYGIRVAVVAPGDAAPTSRRFVELAAAERRDVHFSLFASRDEALAWLVGEPG